MPRSFNFLENEQNKLIAAKPQEESSISLTSGITDVDQKSVNASVKALLPPSPPFSFSKYPNYLTQVNCIILINFSASSYAEVHIYNILNENPLCTAMLVYILFVI
jgi:hypothetical protein